MWTILRKIIKWSLRLLLLWIVITLLPVLLFKFVNPPTTAFMLANDDPLQQWVGLEQISAPMQLAVIAAEDQKFSEHNGFDFAAMGDAISDYWDGKALRGASTISQQTAKNLFCWRDQSLLRKGIEAWFTMLIELTWSKQRILEVYLNVAQFDDMRYGVGVAAKHYYQREAGRLSADQAAWLAAVLPSPENRSIWLPDDETRRQQRWIRRQMRNLGEAYLDRLE